MENALPRLEAWAQSGAFRFLPVVRELSADLITPVLAMLRLRDRPTDQGFLLESAEGDERIGRYSYLGVSPVATLRVSDRHIAAQGSWGTIPEDGQSYLLGDR